MKSLSTLLITLLFVIPVLSQKTMPLPSPQQLKWHEMEFYLFTHFGPNTFTDKEWGHGDEPENIFNPTQLDCEQWCRIAKAASPEAASAALSIGKGAQLNLALSLDLELAGTGLNVAIVTITQPIKAGAAFDASRIAEVYWRIAQQERRGGSTASRTAGPDWAPVQNRPKPMALGESADRRFQRR